MKFEGTKQNLNIKNLNVGDKVTVHTSYYQLEIEILYSEIVHLSNNTTNLVSTYCAPGTILVQIH